MGDPRALLSPSSSRYAFAQAEPAPLAGLADLSLEPMPALDAETQQAVETFTRELATYQSWLQSLTPDQRRTAVGLLVDACVADTETAAMVQTKLDHIRRNSNVLDSVRAMSPLLTSEDVRPGTLDGILSPLMVPQRPRSAGPGNTNSLYGMVALGQTDSPVPTPIVPQFGGILPQQQQSTTAIPSRGQGTNVMSELLNDRGRSSFGRVVSKGSSQTSSVPPHNRNRNIVLTPLSPSSTPVTPNMSGNTQLATSSNALHNTPTSGTASSVSITSIELLENVPAWLKALRLHKYTDQMKHLQWRDMVMLGDEDLEKLGVSTVGARNKLLKSFQQVREVHM